MATQPLPATDSAAELHELIGDDATATFESDPTFIESNPTGSASSENLEEQRPGAGKEFQAEELKAATRGAGPDADEEDQYTDEPDDEDEDFDDDDEEDDDLEDDEEDEDDYEDDDEEDYEDDDEEEDDEDEDEDDEDLDASPSSVSEMMWADGLLGYEDEADDTANKVDRVTGDVQRERADARKYSFDPDENPEDAYAEVDPEAEREERDDSNITIRPVKPVMDFAAMAGSSFGSHTSL